MKSYQEKQMKKELEDKVNVQNSRQVQLLQVLRELSAP